METPRKGIKVCNFGKTTGAKCDEIYKLNIANGSYKGLVATKKHNTSGGDSGGPWYYGGTAYGIHSGYTTIMFKKRSRFTPASNLPAAVGMEINTK